MWVVVYLHKSVNFTISKISRSTGHILMKLPVRFTSSDLTFGLVVAESHPQAHFE